MLVIVKVSLRNCPPLVTCSHLPVEIVDSVTFSKEFLSRLIRNLYQKIRRLMW